MKISRLVAVAAAGMAVALAATPAAADPTDDKAKVDRQIAQTRAALEVASDRVSAAAEAFEQANAQLPAVQDQLAQAEGILTGAQAHAKATSKRVAQADAALSSADRALLAATNQVERSRQTVAKFARDAYTGGTFAQVDALLTVGDPGEFVAGLTYLEHINEIQQRALDSHEAARVDQMNKQNAQVERKRAADEAKADADTAVREAAAAKAKAAQAEASVQHVIDQREAALKVAESERAATEQRYQELQAESDRIAAEIRALAKGGGPVLRPGARLPMPVVGWKSSDFGMRYDPFYKRWQLHAGVDLAAGGGLPIWAAAAGKVFKAGWNGGYGNYTCIYHGTLQGKGFATCYAHQSAIVVKLGQQVSQGQVIGRVGTTGASTGNHLHFEVRLDGTPVNPLPWLPACLC